MSGRGVALHEDLRRSHAVAGASERSFGIVFSILFLVIAIWPIVRGDVPRWWMLGIGLAFAALALLQPRLLAPLNRTWLTFGKLLNRIVSPVVLAGLYYLVFTPMGLAMRAMGKDLLRVKLDPDATSYWHRRDDTEQPANTMTRQF